MEPQVTKLLLREQEHKISWEARQIAPYRLIQNFRFNAVEFREVRVENYLLPTNPQDSPLDPLRRNGHI